MRKLMSLCLPGKEMHKRPMRIVRIPWPGRNSIAIPAVKSTIPAIFLKTISGSVRKESFCRGDFDCIWLKKSSGSLLI